MKILVAIDFSAGSNVVIEQTKKLAKGFSAEVWLLHVAEPDPDFVGWEAGPDTVRQAKAKDFHNEHKKLQELASDMRKEGYSATALLVQGATAEMILKEAEKIQALMIIIGSHGHSAIYDLMVGSVSETVLRKAQCPVLIVPTRKSD